jgi:thiol:disulfide interchange protein DsbD
MKKIILFFIVLLISGNTVVKSQTQQPVKWTFEIKEINRYEVKVIAHATIDEGWKMYGISVPKDGPFPTNLVLEPNDTFRPVKKTVEDIKPVVKHDDVFDMEVPYFKKKATISHNVRILKRPSTIKGYVEFMTCNDESCLPPDEVEFSFEVK